MEPKVLAVVTNFKRPINTIRICGRLAGQACDVVVADNAPEGLNLRRTCCMDIFCWSTNVGPPCRFVPALALAPRYDFILFLDDDFLPGNHIVRNFLDAAQMTNGEFATLGVIGRNYRWRNGEWSYMKRNVRLADDMILTPTDMTARCHFVQASRLWVVAKMASLLGEDVLEDDILLNQGIQMEYGEPSYLLPKMNPEARCIERELPDGGVSFCARPDHKAKRSALINEFARMGWERQF